MTTRTEHSGNRTSDRLAPFGFVAGDIGSFGPCSVCHHHARGKQTWWKSLGGNQWRMLCLKCSVKEADSLEAGTGHLDPKPLEDFRYD
jgi:hypothetical protein